MVLELMFLGMSVASSAAAAPLVVALVSFLGVELLVLQVVALVAPLAEPLFWLKMPRVLVCMRHALFVDIALREIFCY